MAKIEIDYCTAATTPLECRFRDRALSDATGFFWRTGDQVNLVTNWHVVTGRHPVTGQHLSDHGGEPDSLIIDSFVGRNLAKRLSVSVPLYNANGEELWKEHRRWRSAADVVVITLGDVAHNVFALNDFRTLDGAVSIGMDVFVLGYPRGIGPERLAIWKRASIASEPDVDVDGFPLRLVDTATAPGMSGGPVIQRYRGQAQRADGATVMGINAYQMLGVYSGRLPGRNEHEVSLGRVWKQHLIDEIVTHGVSGSREPRAEVLPAHVDYTVKSGVGSPLSGMLKVGRPATPDK